jgi:hypothetical protein
MPHIDSKFDAHVLGKVPQAQTLDGGVKFVEEVHRRHARPGDKPLPPPLEGAAAGARGGLSAWTLTCRAPSNREQDVRGFREVVSKSIF